MTQQDKETAKLQIFVDAMQAAAEGTDSTMEQDWYTTIMERAEGSEHLGQMTIWFDACMKRPSYLCYPKVIKLFKRCKTLARTIISL